MKRKMLAAFLAATMVGGLLVGCGNSGDTLLKSLFYMGM